jgi:alpha-tubulin suppressor-like RCC1 family protein
VWNGFAQEVAISTLPKSVSRTVQVRDPRTERVTGSIVAPLTLKVTDNLGQVTEQELPVTVVEDRVPDASRLIVEHSATAFYGENAKLTIDGFLQANDGNDPVKVTLIETNPAAGTQTQLEQTNLARALNHSLSMPLNDSPDNTYRFKVRITDHLGQSSDSEEFMVQLWHRPNELRFFHTPEQGAVNLAQVASGESVSYQVAVLDKRGRRVPFQPVRWLLQAIAADGTLGEVQVLGSSVSNSDGLALLSFNSALKTGRYRLGADLVDSNPKIETAMGLRISAGETRMLEFAHVGRVIAGETFILDITARDAGGNWTEYDSQTLVNVRLPFEGFHFGFANGVSSQLLSEGGEIAAIRMQGGRAQVPVAAASMAGSYVATAETPVPFESVRTAYDFTGSGQMNIAGTFGFEVVAGEPFLIHMEEKSRNNLPLGDPERLEAGETVTVGATLVDKYYNRVHELDPTGVRSPANLALDVAVDGDAVINGGAQSDSVLLNQGYGSFEIRTDQIEQVKVTGTATQPELATLAGHGELALDFLKPYPAVSHAVVETVVDSLINPITLKFNEPIIVDETSTQAPATIHLDGEETAGNFELKPEQVIFTPDEPLELGRCYTVRTLESSLRGAAVNDPVLAQELSVCAQRARLQVPDYVFVREGAGYSLAIALENGLVPAALYQGQATVTPAGGDASIQPFSWLDSLIDIPVHSGTPFEDGTAIRVTVSGNDGQGAVVSSANEITLRVLQDGGDFDGDGLSNALEFSLQGLDPANEDSNDNGISDGLDDLDGDGLNNSEEMELGTRLDKTDSDDDGLSDYDEIYIHGTDPLIRDSDGDGIPDYVEVISESDPGDPFDASVDPFYITAIDVDPKSITHTLGVDPATFRLKVIATFVHNGLTFDDVDISDRYELLEFYSSDNNVVSVTFEGEFAPHSEGTAELEVIFIEKNLIQRVAIEVVASAVEPVLNSALSAGWEHTCVIADQGLRCWGENWAGQIDVPDDLGNVIAVSAGYANTCALSDAGVRCWGESVWVQEVPGDLSNPSAITTGENHACALTDSGIRCWGDNGYGQLDVPADIVSPTAIAAGYDHTCALDEGQVRCWGDGEYGQLEVPADLINPTQIVSSDARSCVLDEMGVRCWGDTWSDIEPPRYTTGISAIAIAYEHACAIVDGGVQCWGYNGVGQTDVPDDLVAPVAIAVGDYHSCALTRDGVRCWGSQRGFDDANFDVVDPLRLFAGGFNTCLVMESGTRCWGADATGQNELPSSVHQPTSIAMGGEYGCAVEDGQVSCWGNSGHGRTAVPAELPHASQVATGETHACALTDEGVRCWGSSYYGETNVPERHRYSTSTIAVAAGWMFSCAAEDYYLSCWGTGGAAQVPGELLEPSGPITALAAGNSHACAVMNGEVICWGDDGAGQLQVPADITNPTQLALGYEHSCALTDTGVRCWGGNGNGQADVPPDLLNPVQIAAGSSHTCALTEEGLRCWGEGVYGESTVPQYRPFTFSWMMKFIDSDGDGINDYDEVHIHGTDPLKPDTDGDRIPDYVELISGSDPTDPIDVSVDPAYITDIKVTPVFVVHRLGSSPETFRLTVNATFVYDGVTVTDVDISGYHEMMEFRVSNPGVVTVSQDGEFTPHMEGSADLEVTFVEKNLRKSVSLAVAQPADPLAWAFTSGESHVCAIADQGVRCRGYNWSGQLNVPGDLENITAVAAADGNACAIADSGVRCWGASAALTDNLPVDLSTPSAITVGYQHACALTDTGIRCWGDDQYEYGLMDVPGDVLNATAVSAGRYHTCAIADGTVRCWGNNNNGQTDVPADMHNPRLLSSVGYRTCAVDDVGVRCWGRPWYNSSPPTDLVATSAIAIGVNHGCAMTDEGIRCWGEAWSGQTDVPDDLVEPMAIAVGNNYSCALTKEGVRCWGGDAPDFDFNNFDLVNPSQVFAGGYTSCALTETGPVCWGDGGYSQTSLPANITLPTAMTANNWFSCAIEEGQVYCWGGDNYGVLDVPADIQYATAVSAGGYHACALASTGVRCWGYNSYGQTNVPADLVNPTAIATGEYFSCALTDMGVRCWGANWNGVRNVPQDLVNPTRIAAGNSHVCALTDTGVRCWGHNGYGQLNVPVDLNNPTSIVAGLYHNCALTDDGVRCWGINWDKQLDVPTGLTNPVQIAAGSNHNCALADEGVRCWGNDSYGQTRVPQLSTFLWVRDLPPPHPPLPAPIPPFKAVRELLANDVVNIEIMATRDMEYSFRFLDSNIPTVMYLATVDNRLIGTHDCGVDDPMTVKLEEGIYKLLIGACPLSFEDAIAGYNPASEDSGFFGLRSWRGGACEDPYGGGEFSGDCGGGDYGGDYGW